MLPTYKQQFLSVKYEHSAYYRVTFLLINYNPTRHIIKIVYRDKRDFKRKAWICLEDSKCNRTLIT